MTLKLTPINNFMYIPILFSLLALQLKTSQQMEVINVTAGVGFGHNLTLHIVDDSVTWYTAKDSCQNEIPGSDFSMCGYDCSVYTALKLDRLN
ncbi:Hypothetical predicted protein, partial [Mytilus galloprovincialis]